MNELKKFAKYCIENKLVEKINEIGDKWNLNNNDSSFRMFFFEMLGVTESNYKTEKKEIFQFANAAISDGEDSTYWFDAMRVSIYEQLHHAK